ncbi:hypothetical protein [Streptomyces sp. NBC_00859]|nr:hypothetical protein OG584_03070 [Streptomyces sp. NBC_00859]
MNTPFLLVRWNIMVTGSTALPSRTAPQSLKHSFGCGLVAWR